jgi:enolase
MKIEKIRAREIYDSRGYPTIACDLLLRDGTVVTSAVPAGTSCGKYEACELRDGGARLRGMGVLKAVATINAVIAPVFEGKEPHLVDMDARMLEMDGTDNRSVLGANAILAVSMAICRAQAHVEMMELYAFIAQICEFDVVALPIPMFNMINGGMHADNKLSMQEILVVPKDIDNFERAMEFGVTVFHALKTILQEQGKSTAVGYEGGFAPLFASTREALDCVQLAIARAKQECEGDAVIGIDVAAAHLYDQNKQRYIIDGKQLSTSELLAWYVELSDAYNIYAIEDGLVEDDWKGWGRMIDILSQEQLVVGDDFYATNSERIFKAIDEGIASAVIIKPNQIGTITETLQAVKLCEESGVPVIVSHRSGETNDTFIADLAVGVSAQHIKAGGLCRGERIAKYNRLMTIERDLFSAYDLL